MLAALPAGDAGSRDSLLFFQKTYFHLQPNKTMGASKIQLSRPETPSVIEPSKSSANTTTISFQFNGHDVRVQAQNEDIEQIRDIINLAKNFEGMLGAILRGKTALQTTFTKAASVEKKLTQDIEKREGIREQLPPSARAAIDTQIQKLKAAQQEIQVDTVLSKIGIEKDAEGNL